MTAADGQPFVWFRNASFSYDGKQWVLECLDLSVPQGQYLCVLGGNGSGKSTLAKHVDALLQPTDGEVLVFGRDTRDERESFFVRANVGMVFQSPDDQLVATLVEDDVAFGPENLGVPNPKLRERVRSALEQVGLSGFEGFEVHALSGGQKQRVAIAGALAMDPAILVLDEATSMLDPRGRAALMRVAAELHQEGMTVIMVTHFMDEAAQAERAIVLGKGRICLDGAPEAVFARSEELAQLGLDLPFASRERNLLSPLGVEVGPCVTAEELAQALCALRDARGERGASCQEPANATADPAAPGPSCKESPVLLDIQDVSYSYGGPDQARSRKGERGARRPSWGATAEHRQALGHVTLEVRRGEFVGLAGHTGSGKSTLIQLTNGLLQPDSGTVRAFGCDLASRRQAAEARTKVGVVFQYPEAQLFAPTVHEDVAFGPTNLGLAPEEVDERVRRALLAVGLPFDEVAERSPFALSGGQQRRAAIAGVLAMDPELLVLDEPAAGLDPKGRKEILGLLQRLHHQGLTVVMASHAMEDLSRLCDRIMVLEAGKVALQGSPAEVFSDAAALKALGLEQPAPMAFAARMREEGFALPRALYDEQTLACDLACCLGASEGGR